MLLEVPLDVWTSKCEGNLNYRLVKGSRSGPDPQEVKDVTGVLLNATNLVIHPGQGVMYAEACGRTRTAGRACSQAPVMVTLPGKSAFPENHPLALRASEVSTTKPMSHFVQKADLVFGIVCSLTRTDYGKTIPPENVLVHSTNDSNDVNKDYEADFALVGDAKLVM